MKKDDRTKKIDTIQESNQQRGGGGGQQNDKIKSLNYRLNLSSFHLDFVVVFSFRYLEWKAQIVILFLFYHH